MNENERLLHSGMCVDGRVRGCAAICAWCRPVPPPPPPPLDELAARRARR